MNRRHKTLYLPLALLVMFGIVVLSGHNYSHLQTDLASCQLCIHHGSSSDALTAEIDTVFLAPVLTTFIQTRRPAPPANTDYYHQPSRAPPRFS